MAHRTLAGSCRSGGCIAEFVAAPGAGVRRLGCGRHAVVNKCRCRPKPAAPIPPPLQQPAFAPAATLQIPLRIVSEHSVEETWRGQPLTLRRSNATVRGVGTTEALTITLGASELLSVHTSRAKTGFVEVNVTYGNAFRGLKRAAFYSRDGKVLEGDMDGRRIRPFIAGADPNSLRFADGGSPPATEVSPDIKQAIQSIFEKEKELAARGGGGTAPQTPPRPPGPSPPPGPPDPPDSADHGHGSNPAASGGCVGCKAVCYTAAGTCGYGAAAAAAGCIIFYVACLAGGLADCAVASIFCIAACHATGFPCCPTACGDVACCDGDETCLDPNPGVCCSKGLIACAANSCCQPSDTCINATGECCSKDQIVCNHVCCKPGEVCKDGVICCPPKQDVCGGVCCGINALCNEKTGKCCPSQLLWAAFVATSCPGALTRERVFVVASQSKTAVTNVASPARFASTTSAARTPVAANVASQTSFAAEASAARPVRPASTPRLRSAAVVERALLVAYPIPLARASAARMAS